MSFLTVSHITIHEEDGRSTLDDISFSQRRGEKVVIAGETGSGKSSLLKTIAGLIQPTHGEVVFEGNKVIGPADKLVPGHPSIAYLSQHFELPKFLRVEQILSYSNNISEDEADLVFEICRIKHLKTRKSDQLSGGEKQRIAIARLLISSPQLLLLDEPFSHLDISHKLILKSVVREIADKLKITLMLVSHDPGDTLPWADKVIVLRNGKVVQKGAPRKIYDNPVDEYVAGLFGKYNLFEKEELLSVKGIKLAATSKNWVLIRPEHISMSADKRKGIPAIVADVKFYGHHYEVEAETHAIQFTFYCYLSPPIKGDTVRLIFDQSKIAYC